MSLNDWCRFCFVNFNGGDDWRRCLRVVQRFQNCETVKTRSDIHDRQIDIVQSGAEDLEGLSTAIRGSQATSRFPGGFPYCADQIIRAAGHKENIPFHTITRKHAEPDLSCPFLRNLRPQLRRIDQRYFAADSNRMRTPPRAALSVWSDKLTITKQRSRYRVAVICVTLGEG
jgi:hypothetical protein